MRVLLINSNRSRDLMPVAPVGLSYVAGATRRAGHEVRLVDLILSRDADADLRRAVREFRPAVVGISIRNIDNVARQRLHSGLGELPAQISVIRQALRASGAEEVPLVLGGAAVSILRAATLEQLDADVAVCGEGEQSFLALLSAWENGRSLEEVAGICYRRSGAIVSTPLRHASRIGPSGMQDWIDWRAYERHGATWPIQTKRGCSMVCSYCAYPVIEGRAHRARPVAEVVDEIEEVTHRVAPRTFEIIDSAFNVPADHAAEVCEEVIRRGLKVKLTTGGINPGHASEELFTVMRRAGFNSMMITPEAASETMLRNLRKGFCVEHVVRTADLVRQSGLHSTWFFMLGGPGETEETVEETVSFIERSLDWRRCLSVVFTGIRILPGTELSREAFENGYLTPGTNLSEPIFYQSPLVSEAWILNRLNAAINRHVNIVHAAEEGANPFDRFVPRVLHLAGVVPPYWRFLPLFLRLPPVRSARRRHPLAPSS